MSGLDEASSIQLAYEVNIFQTTFNERIIIRDESDAIASLKLQSD